MGARFLQRIRQGADHLGQRWVQGEPANSDIVCLVDLRQLEMAIAVADNASFTRASQQLYVAQSAISRKIKLLEEELGEPIFKRVNKKIYVTPAGQTLLRYARRISTR